MQRSKVKVHKPQYLPICHAEDMVTVPPLRHSYSNSPSKKLRPRGHSRPHPHASTSAITTVITLGATKPCQDGRKRRRYTPSSGDHLEITCTYTDYYPTIGMQIPRLPATLTQLTPPSRTTLTQYQSRFPPVISINVIFTTNGRDDPKVPEPPSVCSRRILFDIFKS